MKAADRLRATFGANMAESMARPDTVPVRIRATGPTAPDRYEGLQRVKGAFLVPLDRITPDPDQPRKEFDEDALADLAASLKSRGQLQPVRARWSDELARWVIVSGERRFRAATVAGLPALAVVEAGPAADAAENLIDQLTENCVREDLKPVEQARAYQALMDFRGWTQAQVAEHLHVPRSAVSKALAMLTLPGPALEDVDAGLIPVQTAYEISRVKDPAEKAARIATARAGGRAAGKTRAKFAVRGGHVSVNLDGDQDHARVVAALREAVRKATGSHDAA